MAKKSKTSSLLRPSPFWILVVLIVAFLAIIGLQVSGITHFFAKKTVTGISSDKNPYSLPPSKGFGSSGQSSKLSSQASLVEPSGNFVSNHHPNLSGTPAPDQEQSVCADVPGATCQISFTRDGVIKYLPVKKIDNSGAAYWTWKLQDIGLTEGAWQVKAKAALNGNNKVSSDSMTLEVSP